MYLEKKSSRGNYGKFFKTDFLRTYLKGSSRKAHIPDPEIIFQIGNRIVGVLLTKKVIDSVVDRVLNNLLDEVDRFYALTREHIVKYSKLVIPKNRPQTYVFKMREY